MADRDPDTIQRGVLGGMQTEMGRFRFGRWGRRVVLERRNDNDEWDWIGDYATVREAREHTHKVAP